MGTLREELQALYETNGDLTPAMVVEAATPVDHPLHNRFEWNDETAGEKFRLHQARQLIRSVRIRVIVEDDPSLNYDVRAYQMVRRSDGSHGYQATTEVVQDPFISRLILANMEREWRSLKERYEQFHEFWKLVNADVEGRSEGTQRAIEKYGAYIA